MIKDYATKLTNEQIINFLKQHYNVSEVEIERTKKWGILCSTMKTAKEGEDKINIFLCSSGCVKECGPYVEGLELAFIKLLLDNFSDNQELVSSIMNDREKLRAEENSRHNNAINNLDKEEIALFGTTLADLAKIEQGIEEQTSLFDSNDEQLKIDETQPEQPK